MFANAKALVVVVSCALVAHAQSSGTPTTTAPASGTSAAGLDTCITNCLTTALTSSTCTSYTDLSCVCTSTDFQAAAAACLLASCTTDDVATAQALQSQECAGLTTGSVPTTTAASTAGSTGTTTPATSGGATTSAASTGTSKPATSTGTATSATQSATSTSAAVALAPFSLGSLFGTLVASAGALVGAVFVL